MKRTKLRLATVLCGSLGLATAVAGPAAAAPSPRPEHPALAAAITEWFANGGDTRLTALQTDFQAIAKAAGQTDMLGVTNGCAALGADVDKAQHYDPLPDAQAQQHWSAALNRYAQGAADCVKGAENLDGGLLLKANDEVLQGSAELAQATERVQDILD